MVRGRIDLPAFRFQAGRLPPSGQGKHTARSELPGTRRVRWSSSGPGALILQAGGAASSALLDGLGPRDGSYEERTGRPGNRRSGNCPPNGSANETVRNGRDVPSGETPVSPCSLIRETHQDARYVEDARRTAHNPATRAGRHHTTGDVLGGSGANWAASITIGAEATGQNQPDGAGTVLYVHPTLLPLRRSLGLFLGNLRDTI